MKKFVKYLLVVCLMIPFAFMFSGCSQNDPANVMTMSVNPEVSFVLDANNKVVSVKYENEDAGVIYADVNFVGKDVDTLIQLFIERATISGHVDLSGDEVTITVNGKTDADVNALRQKAKEQVEKVFNSLGIEVTVAIDNTTAMAQKEALKVTAKALAPEKSLNELDAMSNAELIKLISDKQNELKDLTYEQAEAIKNSFSSAKNQVLQVIEQAKASLEGFEEQLKALEETYKNQIPEAIKAQINILKDQIKQLKSEIETKVNEFLEDKKAEIQQAKKQYETLKNQLVTEFKTQVETEKGNVKNHLQTSLNNGTISQEQYDYYVSLIDSQN